MKHMSQFLTALFTAILIINCGTEIHTDKDKGADFIKPQVQIHTFSKAAYEKKLAQARSKEGAFIELSAFAFDVIDELHSLLTITHEKTQSLQKVDLSEEMSEALLFALLTNGVRNWGIYTINSETLKPILAHRFTFETKNKQSLNLANMAQVRKNIHESYQDLRQEKPGQRIETLLVYVIQSKTELKNFPRWQKVNNKVYLAPAYSTSLKKEVAQSIVKNIQSFKIDASNDFSFPWQPLPKN